MEPKAFFDWIIPEVKALQTQYNLQAWQISLRVVPESELSVRHAAEVAIREEYRGATIYLCETLVHQGDKTMLLEVVDHELQHIFLHPLDALRSIVMDAVPESLRVVIGNEFFRTNERVRASVERLLAGERRKARLLAELEPASKEAA